MTDDERGDYEDTITRLRAELAEAKERVTKVENNYVEQFDKAVALERELAEMKDRQRVLMCGYCGENLYTHPFGEEPTEDECKHIVDLGQAHDRVCGMNPLARELAEAKKLLSRALIYLPHDPANVGNPGLVGEIRAAIDALEEE